MGEQRYKERLVSTVEREKKAEKKRAKKKKLEERQNIKIKQVEGINYKKLINELKQIYEGKLDETSKIIADKKVLIETQLNDLIRFYKKRDKKKMREIEGEIKRFELTYKNNTVQESKIESNSCLVTTNSNDLLKTNLKELIKHIPVPKVTKDADNKTIRWVPNDMTVPMPPPGIPPLFAPPLPPHLLFLSSTKKPQKPNINLPQKSVLQAEPVLTVNQDKTRYVPNSVIKKTLN